MKRGKLESRGKRKKYRERKEERNACQLWDLNAI